VVAAAAAATALLTAAPPARAARPDRLPTAADGVVERLEPKILYLQTRSSIDEVKAFLYAPPKGTAVAAARAVIFFSGEWGWTPLLQDTASSLSFQGRRVLGIDATGYFTRLVDNAARRSDLDMLRGVVNEAAGKPKDTPVLLVGFSYGAETIPYFLNRAGVRGVDGALLIAPGSSGAAVFRAAVQMRMPPPADEAFSVEGEYLALPPIPIAILEGELDDKAHGRALYDTLRGPKKYLPIAAADHQFHDTRQPYLDQVGLAIRWLESEAQSRPASPGGGAASPGSAGAPGASGGTPGPGESRRPLPPGFVPGAGFGGHPAPAPSPKPTPTPSPSPASGSAQAPGFATPTVPAASDGAVPGR
jgi:dienelactone hydrolase